MAPDLAHDLTQEGDGLPQLIVRKIGRGTESKNVRPEVSIDAAAPQIAAQACGLR